MPLQKMKKKNQKKTPKKTAHKIYHSKLKTKAIIMGGGGEGSIKKS